MRIQYLVKIGKLGTCTDNRHILVSDKNKIKFV